jgi:hypothetical protein
MANEIISYLEMCRRERVSLQRGMNFGLGRSHSVILMSLRTNAPYEDELQDGGTVLIYEGHDEPKNSRVPDPKRVDQPEHTRGGRLTQNGLFCRAAQEVKAELRLPERVRVYEKLRQGIWSYNGVFHLVDARRQERNGRSVFKFRLIAVEGEDDLGLPVRTDAMRRRLIPTHVKLEVWKRDAGQCVICGSPDELHFDHVVPYSKGGTSLVAENFNFCALATTSRSVTE